MNTFKYRLFGFDVLSDTPLYGVPAAEFESPDVILERQDSLWDESLVSSEGMVGMEAAYIYGEDFIKFYKVDTGFYRVSEGKRIAYSLKEDCDPTNFYLTLMNFAFPRIIIERANLTVHGSVLSYNDKSVLISGESGAGKSTMTTELINNGLGFMSDDVMRIGFNDKEEPVVYSSHPIRRLCRDTVEHYGFDPKKLKPVTLDERFKYFVDSSDVYEDRVLPTSVMFYLTINDGDKPEIREITGADKIMMLLNNFYRSEDYVRFGTQPQMYKLISKMGAALRIYEISRPREGMTIKDRAQMVMDVLKKDFQ
ncbi:HPr Serine kinase C-terminal domain-containing protein [Lachnospiraceae bacterium]|nr:HPr Serine kinase C-terminal domain-containing protein [Lachnospiraceae bacterium]